MNYVRNTVSYKIKFLLSNINSEWFIKFVIFSVRGTGKGYLSNTPTLLEVGIATMDLTDEFVNACEVGFMTLTSKGTLKR